MDILGKVREGHIAMTINLDDTRQYFSDSDRISKVLNKYSEICMKYIRPYYDYYFNVELSTPDDSQSNNRIHIHGVLLPRDEYSDINFRLSEWTHLKTVSQFKYKVIDNVEKWITYINKDILFNKYLQKKGYPPSFSSADTCIFQGLRKRAPSQVQSLQELEDKVNITLKW